MKLWLQISISAKNFYTGPTSFLAFICLSLEPESCSQTFTHQCCTIRGHLGLNVSAKDSSTRCLWGLGLKPPVEGRVLRVRLVFLDILWTYSCGLVLFHSLATSNYNYNIQYAYSTLSTWAILETKLWYFFSNFALLPLDSKSIKYSSYCATLKKKNRL